MKKFQKWYHFITIPILFTAWFIAIGVGIGFAIRVVMYPIQWGWAIAERLLQ